MNKIIKS